MSHLLKFTRTGGVHLTQAGRAFLLPRFQRHGLDLLACTNLSQLKACFKQLRRAERAELARMRHFDRREATLGFENLRFLEIMLSDAPSGRGVPFKVATPSESGRTAAVVHDLFASRKGELSTNEAGNDD